MNKNELINAFAESCSLQKKQAAEILECFFDLIIKTLEKHEEIKLIGFGTFKIVKVKPKIITNPQTKQKMQIKGYDRVRFIPGQALKDKVNKS